MTACEAQRDGTPRPVGLEWAFALAGTVVLVAGLLTLRAALDFQASSLQLQQAYTGLSALQGLQTRYLQTDSALRAYLVTNIAEFRGDYERGLADVDAALSQALASAGPGTGGGGGAPALDGIATLVATRRATMQQILQAFDRGGLQAMRDIGMQLPVRDTESRLLRLLGEATTSREALINARVAEDGHKLARLEQLLLVFSGASLATLCLVFVRARRGAARQESLTQEMERQRRISDSILENAPIGVYLKDARNLTLVRVNRRIEEMAGRDREELLGRSEGQFTRPVAGSGPVQDERALVQARQMLSFEERQIETAQGPRTMHVRKVLIPDEHGDIRYLLGLSEDITDRRSAERAQREFADTLERKGRELEAANKELESFSYSVSHDLRAPLRAIEGYAAILDEECGAQLDDAGRDCVASIREGATRMSLLIRDLLGFSRLSRQPLSVAQVDTRQLVLDAWQALRAAQPALQARLELGALPPSWGDARLLSQAWTNLLENAVKYSSKVQAPQVTVGGELAADGSEAVFHVQDNGVGFDMRYYDRLFSVFQRLHSEAEYAGMGVGLAIVQRIIARHGGHIEARSEPGRGATFTFALPAVPRN